VTTRYIRTQAELADRYDLALGLAAQGLSYSQMAARLDVKLPTQAMVILRQARAALVPYDVPVEARTRPPLPMIAWAAGFFDGEGCVFGYEGIQPNGCRRFTFGVAVVQVMRGPLERFVEHWGGSIRARPQSNPEHRQQFRWEVKGAGAAGFLEDVLPYLTVKQPVALVALPVMFRTHRHGIAYSEAEVAERRRAVAEMAVLNKRGVR
jgi:hypothetical protein